MVRQDIVHSERCLFAHFGAYTSQIGLEITDFATLASRGDCCDALHGTKLEMWTFKNTNLFFQCVPTETYVVRGVIS